VVWRLRYVIRFLQNTRVQIKPAQLRAGFLVLGSKKSAWLAVKFFIIGDF
jgi:hypothetical protein